MAAPFDIGCGSGLHSLAALKLGASRLVAIDYDPLSVSHHHGSAGKILGRRPLPGATRRHPRFGPRPRAERGRVLLGRAAPYRRHEPRDPRRRDLVAPGGLLVLALCGKTRYCGTWTRIKRWYCQADEASKRRRGLVRAPVRAPTCCCAASA
ncbi:MAG: 50S ribosomal protein L11 methyltransferase [Sulfuritalea sp.]|nr:50S ribosomal protein L11 methyltransferase [Sulfuritalea sp.]